MSLAFALLLSALNHLSISCSLQGAPCKIRFLKIKSLFLGVSLRLLKIPRFFVKKSAVGLSRSSLDRCVPEGFASFLVKLYSMYSVHASMLPVVLLVSVPSLFRIG